MRGGCRADWQEHGYGVLVVQLEGVRVSCGLVAARFAPYRMGGSSLL